MAQRIIKNYTEVDYILADLGELVVPSRGAIDLGGAESRLIELAGSDSLLEMLSKGVDKYQINDGSCDLSFSDGIDLIRRISKPTPIDQLGRWVVRAESRRKDFDTVFVGIGDNIEEGKIGGGTELRWDFSADGVDSRWMEAPVGFKKQKFEWRFIDTTYIKEGVIYFFKAPKGTFLDFKFLVPKGYPFFKKYINTATDDPYWDKNYVFTTEDTIIGEWVINHWIEGDCPAGDALNTEAAHENPSPTYIIYRCEVTVPDVAGYEQCHGHISLEMYRGRTVVW